jgi:SAM-dependent methyltransferase
MANRALWWLGGAFGGAAIAYWQVVLAEGAYLGPGAVRLIYSLGALHYDEVRSPWQAAADAALRPVLAAALAGRARPAVLDVATGTGRVPRLLAAEPGFAGSVAALDLTPSMLAVARRTEPAGTPVGWVVAEAGRLPWPDSCFDLVTCLEALEYFPRPRRALAAMARVLRPGGTLVISKWPDGWARLLPGRALAEAALRRELSALGLVDLAVRPWQHGHYELVLARKV